MIGKKQALLHAVRLFGTQKDFAKKLCVTQGYVSHLVTGRNKVPARMAVRIEQATKKAITREMLLPDDWFKIWPELGKNKT